MQKKLISQLNDVITSLETWQKDEHNHYENQWTINQVKNILVHVLHECESITANKKVRIR